MDTWTLEWDDGASQNSPPLPYEEWRLRPVPLGAARAVVAQFRGFYGVPADLLLVTWDDNRVTVRLTTGDLCWYVDETTARFPQHGEIAVQDRWSPYPGGNRYMDAMAVRSLRDLVDTVNADTITSIDLSGTIHILKRTRLCQRRGHPGPRKPHHPPGIGNHRRALVAPHHHPASELRQQSSPARRHPHRTAGALTQRPVCDAKPGCSTRWWVQPLCAREAFFLEYGEGNSGSHHIGVLARKLLGPSAASERASAGQFWACQ